jgi:hypothetical protein
MFIQLRGTIHTNCSSIPANYACHLSIVVAPQMDLRQSLEMLSREAVDTSSDEESEETAYLMGAAPYPRAQWHAHAIVPVLDEGPLGQREAQPSGWPQPAL